ncbi:MAG: hypothetical protein GX846_04015 [Deltaproteobacteria bacterium]|nr:hypothetical protein [Deltaproteobacteria bacterium]
MKLEITVPEVIDLIKEIRNEQGNLFEMIRENMQETVGKHLKISTALILINKKDY